MPTLSEFLIARLDEEAKVAQEMVDESDHLVHPFSSPANFACHDEAPHVGYSPEHVLADIEAKRVIVRECRYEQTRTPVSPRARGLAGYTLWCLVHVYANHKDYRSEWEWVSL